MSGVAQIAHRYAKALFDLSDQEQSTYAIRVSMQELGALVASSPEFRSFIYNPLLLQEERAKIIKSTLEGKIPTLLFKFISYINFKNRLDLLKDIIKSFNELYLQKNNQIEVRLETPYILKDDQKKSVQQKFGQKFNKEILLNSETNEELLGGFRLFADGILYDSSIKNQLQQFKQKVLA